jgi:ribosomal protein S12 methylthiotransferase accessory factor
MDIKITFPSGKKVNAEINGFTHKTDQAVISGGEGSAPEPFSTFLSSIGTCAGIYVLGFCQQRGIETDGMEIIQSMNFNPFSGMIDKIILNIILPEGFPGKYKKAVINSANLCAVKKHLEKPPQFSIITT